MNQGVCTFWSVEVVGAVYDGAVVWLSVVARMVGWRPVRTRCSSRTRSVVMSHKEVHRTHRIGWLRAAVLGANDGIVSTASLIIGVAASNATRSQVLVAGMAGLVAGAMSMAAGEYVSVSSQADTEAADLGRERKELREDPERELRS